MKPDKEGWWLWTDLEESVPIWFDGEHCYYDGDQLLDQHYVTGVFVIFDTIKFNYDSYIIIQETHGEVEQKWKAYERDSRKAAYGNSKREAVDNLIKSYRDEACEIELAAARHFEDI